MIYIKNGRIENIKEILIYPPEHIFETILIKPFVDILKENYNITMVCYEENENINLFDNIKKITLPRKMSIFSIISKRKEYKRLNFDFTVDITDYPHIFYKIFTSNLRLSFKDNKNANIFLRGDFFVSINRLLSLLGIEKNIKIKRSKRKNKGFFGLSSFFQQGFIEVKNEKDIEKVGHLYTFKNKIAAEAYLMGIDLTLFLTNESTDFIPKDIKIFYIKSLDDIKNYIYEDTSHSI